MALPFRLCKFSLCVSIVTGLVAFGVGLTEVFISYIFTVGNESAKNSTAKHKFSEVERVSLSHSLRKPPGRSVTSYTHSWWRHEFRQEVSLKRKSRLVCFQHIFLSLCPELAPFLAGFFPGSFLATQISYRFVSVPITFCIEH